MAMVAIMRGDRPPRPTDLTPDELWKLIQRCWGPNRHRRPEMSEVLQDLGRLQVPPRMKVSQLNAKRQSNFDECGRFSGISPVHLSQTSCDSSVTLIPPATAINSSFRIFSAIRT